MTITEQLDQAYAAGKFAVVVTQWKMMPIRRRDMIREAKGGVEIRSGKKWVYAFAYQVKFARDV